jgi:hypothetical protein
MTRLGVSAVVFLALAVPALAQTAAGSAAEGTVRTAPEVAPQAAPSDTSLPGVTDSGTTGSTVGTGPTGSAPTDQERCQVPGTTTDSNPTGGVPSVSEANPACR